MIKTNSNVTDPIGASFTAMAPSNIAFVKYWGKRDAALQWPANDSLSMTLSGSRTITTARLSGSQCDSFTMDGRAITSAEQPSHKIFRHVTRVREALGLKGFLDIESANTFPTGCGIASSASGFGALTLASAAALTGEHTWDGLTAKGATRSRLADLARMGSGSACRSLYGGFVKWTAGDHPSSQKITPEFNAEHWDLADIIVVLSDKEKHVSSSEAHLAAWGSPLFATRLAGIPSRMRQITDAITNRNLEILGREIEADALEMHAVAMTGTPNVNYFTPDTIKFTSWIRTERDAGRIPAWFTIDAGPNVHLICRAEDAEFIATRIRREWRDTRLIMDRVGRGPTICRGRLEDLNV